MTPSYPNPFDPNTFPASKAQAENAMILGQLATENVDRLIADISTRVLQWIATALQQQVDAVGQLGQKVAAPIVAKLNSAEAATGQIQSAVSGSIQGQLTVSQGSGAGSTEGGSVRTTPYNWTVFQYIQDPYQVELVRKGDPLRSNDDQWCVRGGYDDFVEANTYGLSIAGTKPPPGCYGPGGPIQPVGTQLPGTDCPPTGPYTAWQRVNPDGTASCVVLCAGATGPPGYVSQGSVSPSEATANAPLGVAYNCQAPTVQQQPQWYAGCVSGQSVSWDSNSQPPTGVSGQVGPFATQALATSALGTSCTSGTGTGTGNQTTGSTPCCDTSVTKLPDCIYIDLCSPDKVAEAIYRGLCKWSQDDGCFHDPIVRSLFDAFKKFYEWCPSKFNNDTAYQVEDCKGPLQEQIDSYLERFFPVVAAQPNCYEIARNGLNGLGG